MKWRCTHCGKVTIAPFTPESCSHCGEVRFLHVKTAVRQFLNELRRSFVLHAVTAHFPNALIPSAVALIVYAAVTAAPCVAEAAFFMALLAVLFIPLTLLSGLRDWKRYYGGKKAPLFQKKIRISCILLGVGITALLIHPQPGQPYLALRSWLFIVLMGVMLGLTVLLGHYGGKLVFQLKR